KGLVTGLKITSEEVPDPICEPCLASKMNANPFLPSPPEHRATRPLERIHSDVHQLKTWTQSGYQSGYRITFIDDFLRFRAVIFMKCKSEAFDAFREFKAYAENITGFKIAEFQMDKGGE